jgi:hypothetical protein
MAGFTAAAALLGLVALVYGVSWLAGVARSPLTAAPFTGGGEP